MVYIHCFICDLETGASHAEMHRVHIYAAGEGLALGRLGPGVLILVNWHLDLDLLLATLVDRLRQA